MMTFAKWAELIGRPKASHSSRIQIRWVVGGKTGGSCYGDEPDMRVSAEPEPPFQELDEILLKTSPSISFLVYQSMCRDLIEVINSEDGDYYGNSYSYVTKRVNLKKLFTYLQDRNLLPGE